METITIIHAGNGESCLEFSASEWKRLCKLMRKACEKSPQVLINEKLDSLETAGQECSLMKWDCHKLAEALERVLPRAEKARRLREEAEGFISFLRDADGFEKE